MLRANLSYATRNSSDTDTGVQFIAMSYFCFISSRQYTINFPKGEKYISVFNKLKPNEVKA